MKNVFFLLFSITLIGSSLAFKVDANQKKDYLNNHSKKKKIMIEGDFDFRLSMCNPESNFFETSQEAIAVYDAIISYMEDNIVIEEYPEEVREAWTNRPGPTGWLPFGNVIDIEICPGSGVSCPLVQSILENGGAGTGFSELSKGRKYKSDFYFVTSNGTWF